jgi:hypothetical protein
MLFSALTVEFTLNFNHMTNVLGEHGLSGPGQQLPLLIGLFSFVRICWILIKDKYLNRGEEDAAIETPEGGKNLQRAGTGMSDVAVTASKSPPHGPVLQQHAHLNSIPLLAGHTDRPWVQRVMVAYLPWLSDFSLFGKGQQQRFQPVRRGSEGFEMQKTSYDNGRKEADVDVENLGSRKAGPSKELKI